jgi:hypothetical protein
VPSLSSKMNDAPWPMAARLLAAVHSVRLYTRAVLTSWSASPGFGRHFRLRHDAPAPSRLQRSRSKVRVLALLPLLPREAWRPASCTEGSLAIARFGPLQCRRPLARYNGRHRTKPHLIDCHKVCQMWPISRTFVWADFVIFGWIFGTTDDENPSPASVRAPCSAHGKPLHKMQARASVQRLPLLIQGVRLLS